MSGNMGGCPRISADTRILNQWPPTGDGGDDATDSSDSDGSGPSTATVMLGDQTFNFSTEGAVVAQCLTDLFGTFSIQLPMIDDSGGPSDGSVAILVLHEGTDPEEVGQVNAVKVSVGDEDWVADEADMMFEQSELLEPGMSQVDSVEIDGRTVRGTATFFQAEQPLHRPGGDCHRHLRSHLRRRTGLIVRVHHFKTGSRST